MIRMRLAVALAGGLAVAMAVPVAAAPTGTGQERPYRLNDQQLKDLVHRIDTNRKAFHDSFERALDRSRLDDNQAKDQIKRSVKAFEQATELLRNRVNDRQSDTADAENVLRRASLVDDFVMRNQLDAAAQRDWQALRRDMDDLARAYGVAGNWNAPSRNTPIRVNDKAVERLLKDIGKKADRFDKSLDRAFDDRRRDARREGDSRNDDRSGDDRQRDSRRDDGRDGDDRWRSDWRGDDRNGKDQLRQSVKDIKQAAERLRDRVRARQSSTGDVEQVLRHGANIDRFMQRYQLGGQAAPRWRALRADLDGLARAYGVGWDGSERGYTSGWPED